jgi:predicted aldo/keto reductase-like oxidoreductase
MILRKLEGTELKVSVLGLGGGVFNPHKDPNLTLKEAKEVISYAVKNGVNLIDTSKEYDEKFLSEAMGKNKQKLCIISKSEARNEESMLKDLEDSLQKLGKKYIEIYQLHMVNSVEDLDERIKNGVIKALQKAKRNGKIGYIGIFSHRIEVLQKAISTGYFDVFTCIYNAGHRLAENLFKIAKRKKVGIIAAAPFANGILVQPKVKDEVPNPGAEKMSAENALKFVLSNENISSTLVGSRNLSHAAENIEIAKKEWRLSKSERNEVCKNIQKFLGEKFCRGCRYCEPCEIFGGNLPISDILKLKLIYEKYGFKKFARWLFNLKVKSQNIPKCIDCGKCNTKCPYGIEISKELKEAFEILGG